MLTQQLWILWAALIASLLVYAAIPLVLPAAEGEARAADTAGVGAAVAFAVMAVLGSLALRRLALVRPLARGALELGSRAGQTRLYTVSMLCWALSEAVGIVGLLLFLLYRRPELCYPFLAAALGLLLFHAPRASALRRRSGPADLARPDVRIG